MILKAAADGLDVAAAIASEPDVSEFLQMQPAAFEGENPLHPTIESVAPYLDKQAIQQALDFFKKHMAR